MDVSLQQHGTPSPYLDVYSIHSLIFRARPSHTMFFVCLSNIGNTSTICFRKSPPPTLKPLR